MYGYKAMFFFLSILNCLVDMLCYSIQVTQFLFYSDRDVNIFSVLGDEVPLVVLLYVCAYEFLCSEIEFFLINRPSSFPQIVC